MKDRLLTRAEAQQILRVSKTTMFRLIHQKQIPAVWVGKTIRIPESELENYLCRNLKNKQEE